MNTPWGKSDSVTRLERGVSWVGTPSHGGLAITATAAMKALTSKAINIALESIHGTALVNLPKSGYVFFEEDCAYAIAFYEHPEWYRSLEAAIAVEYADNGRTDESLHHIVKSHSNDQQVKADMAEVIRRWFPQYFGEVRR
jgi:hypothetical protein